MRDNSSNTIHCISVFFLALTSIVSFCTVFWGLDFTDSFFHGCNFLLAKKISTFFPLTQGVYLLTNALFGDHIVAYRITNWLIYYAACLLIYFLVNIATERSKFSNLWLLSMAIASIPLTNTNVLNGNSLSSFFISLSFVSCYKWANGSSKWSWGLLFFIILAILSRFPNIVMVIMLMLTSFLIFKQKDITRMFAIVAGATGIYLLIGSFLFGGFTGFFDEVSSSFARNASGSNAGHSINNLLKEYLHTLKDMMSNIKYLSLISILPFFGCLNNKKAGRYVWAIAFFVAQLLFLYFRVDIVSDVINYHLLVYFYSNIIIIVFILCVISLTRKDIKAFGLYLLPLLLSLCAAAGSDTGLVLIGGPLFVLLPWLVRKMQDEVNNCCKEDIVKIICTLLFLTAIAAVFVRNGMMWIGIGFFISLLVVTWLVGKKRILISNPQTPRSNSFLCIKISVALSYALALLLIVNAKLNVSFHDRPIRELTSHYNVPQLKGIWTNPTSKEFFEAVIDDYYAIPQEKSVVFFGRNSAVFSYITKIGMIKGVTFAQDDDEKNLNCLKIAIEDKPIVFLCPNNPGIPENTTLEDYSNTNDILINEGYSRVDRGPYAIYYPSGMLY